MPRFRYPELKKKLEVFAEENQIPGGYRDSGEWEILKMNWELYKKIAVSIIICALFVDSFVVLSVSHE